MTNPSSSDMPNPSENPELPVTASNSPPSSPIVNESPTPQEIASTIRAMADAAATIADLGANLERTSASSTVSSANISSEVVAAAAANDTSGTSGGGTSGDFFSQLKGVPIDYLISTPLIAAARSNMALATVMLEFIDMIGFEKDGTTTRKITFNLERPYEDPVTKKWADTPQQIKVEAPLLGLVPIPALLIDSVDINLTVKIDNNLNSTSNTTSKAGFDAGSDWGWGHATFTGSVSTSQTNTRTTDQSATFTVDVRAQQQPLPEGMARLMDVMASCITPLPSK